MRKSLFLLPLLFLLAGCASSERMARMSGNVVSDYDIPKRERISSFRYQQKAKQFSCADRKVSVNGIHERLVNLWPFFFRNMHYVSILWPMIDSDPYGFAIRPFYNHEGDEYSLFFPFSAWNPVNRDGWVLSGYWNIPEKFYGFFPLFHRYYGTSGALNYYSPLWLSSRVVPEKEPPFYSFSNCSARFDLLAMLGWFGEKEYWLSDRGERLWLGWENPTERSDYFKWLLYQYGESPVVPKNIAELRTRMKKHFHRYRSFYSGIFPLYFYDRDETGTDWGFLMLFPLRTQSKYAQSLSFLGPLIGGYWHSVSPMRFGGDHTRLEESTLVSVPLMSFSNRIKRCEDPSLSSVMKRLRVRMERDPELTDRAAFQADIRSLDPKAELPAFVNNKNLLESYLNDLCGKINPRFRTDYSAGCVPVFMKFHDKNSDLWISPLLMTGRVSDQKSSTFLSIPLATYFFRSLDRDRSFVFGPLGWMSENIRFQTTDRTIFSRTQKTVKYSRVMDSWTFSFLGLYHRNAESFFIAKPGLSAKELNALFGKLDRCLEKRSAIRREKQTLKNRERKKWIVKTKIDHYRYLIEQEEIKLAYEKLDGKIEQNDMLSLQISEQLNELGISGKFDSKAGVQTIKKQIYAKCTDLRTVRRMGSSVLYRKSVYENGDYDWSFLGPLAAGFKNGSVEESQILQFFYRHKRSGTRRETLYFPFLSVQEDGPDRRVSFCWRLWEQKTVKGKRSGYCFFIPY